MSNYKTIIKNFASNGAGFLVEALIAFLMLPYIIHRVGDATYGLWAIVLSLSGYMGILNLGIRPAINKYVAEYSARKEYEKISALVHAGIFIYSFSAVLIILGSALVAWQLEHLFKIPQLNIADCKVVVVFTGIQMSLGLVAVVYGGVISGLQRYEINNGIEIFVMLSRTILILISLAFYQNIYALAVPHLTMTVIGYLLTFIFARKLVNVKWEGGFFQRPKSDALKVLIRFSSITFAINIVGSLLLYIDNILVASIISVTFVTYYVIGSRLVSYTRKMLDAFVSVLAPAASVFHATEEISRLQGLFLYSVRMCKLLAFPCLIFFIVSGRDFIRLWIGYDSLESYQVLMLLAFAAFFTLPQKGAGPILYGINKHKIVLYVSMLEALFTVVLAYVLGHRYGLLGVVSGLAGPSIVLGAVIYPLYLAETIGLPKKVITHAIYIQDVSVFIGFAAGLYALHSYWIAGNIIVLICQFGSCFALYAWYVWKRVLSDVEREKIICLLPGRIAKCFALPARTH